MRFVGFVRAARCLFIGSSFLTCIAASPLVLAQTPTAKDWYAQGVQALSERRLTDARKALLAAVDADPTFAGAWLDLAIATHADGDDVQAEEFLQILEGRFDLPPSIAAGVVQLRAQIQTRSAHQYAQAQQNDWKWRRLAQVGGGYDSNANAGLTLTDLTLTLPGGGVVLPINPEMRQRSDHYLMASLAADGTRKFGDGFLEMSASAKTRNNRHEKAFDTQELQLGLGYSSNRPAFGGSLNALLPGPWRVSANAQQLRLGKHALFNSVSLSAMHAWTTLPCSPQVALEFDLRTFPSVANLDSRLGWLSGGLTCPSLLSHGSRFGATLRLGKEKARHAFNSLEGRPGDSTDHAELTIAHQWRWARAEGEHTLDAQILVAHSHDAEGYSPLLTDNEKRELKRNSFGLVYAFPLIRGDTWIASVALQGFRQTSNLEIFRVKGHVAQLTIQKTW